MRILPTRTRGDQWNTSLNMNTPGHRIELHISKSEDEDATMIVADTKLCELEAKLNSKIDTLNTEMTSLQSSVLGSVDTVQSSMDNKLDKLLVLLRAPATPAPAANPGGGRTNPNQPTIVPSFTTQTEMERTVNMGNPVFQSYGFVAKQVEEALRERTEEDKFYSNTGAPHAPLTAGAQ